MKKIIGKFFATIHLKIFTWRVDWEIRNRILPQLEQGKDYGYPFATVAQMGGKSEDLNPKDDLNSIDTRAKNMPSAYRIAFRYVMHRNLKRQLSMYEQFVRQHIRTTACGSNSIAAPV